MHLETWYTNLPALSDNSVLSRDEWQRVLHVRTAVNRALEDARNDKQVGGSLDAELALYADDGTLETLSKFGDELRFLTITSGAEIASIDAAPSSAEAVDVEGSTLRVRVVASEHKKCVRCWHRREDVGVHPEHPTLCGRCVDNVVGDGEVRNFC